MAVMDEQNYDVVVVGGGNAALCAALSAHEHGARVVVLERAPHAERGGNSSYTDGKMRFAYDGADDIVALAPERRRMPPQRSGPWVSATRRITPSSHRRSSR